MAKADFYSVLGVSKGADADELKRAYRKLAMRYHPDRNPGDKAAEAKFKELNEAYDVLKDDQKRAAYDRFGHAAFEQGGHPGGFDASGMGGAGLGDIFDQMFGDLMGRGRQRGPRTGADIRTDVEIDLTEAFAGTKRTIRVQTRVACETCNGTGSENKERGSDVCGTCGGHGRIRAQQGFFLVERTCATCGGTGRVIRNPCRICRGQGTVARERGLQVSIPAGLEDGMRIRLQGEGEAGGPGAVPGDLYVHVGIKPHKLFQRDGAHIHCAVPLRMTLAALGGEIEVPTIDGGVAKVKISPGVQTGDQQRLRGRGFSVLNSSARGDMFIHLQVETPQKLTRRQRELLEQFDAEAEKNLSNSPQSEGFFARVREFFEGNG